MTSTICWIGVDNRRIASIYIATDSRITNARTGDVLSDSAQKAYACTRRAHIFGYCGNADAPPRALLGLVSAIDDNSLTVDTSSAYRRAIEIEEYLAAYLPPGDCRGTSIVYATRQGEGFRDAEFHAFEYFVEQGRWQHSSCELPFESGMVFACGSGRQNVEKWRERWLSAQRQGTSRAIFSALCNALEAAEDPRSGGAPQLVGIYQRGAANIFGVLYRQECFARGMKVPRAKVEFWRDDLFQRCDPATLLPLPRAARHLRPRGL